MCVHRSNRTGVVLGVLVALLLILVAWQFVEYLRLLYELGAASELVADFEQMRQEAVQTNPRDAAHRMEYIVGFYPSGTKLRTGSLADRIVESERAGAVREIIAHLRRVTGEDLGDSPNAWINKYASR